MIYAFDHVQLAMPSGGEEVARNFYVHALGLTEQPKPLSLGKHGGAWFSQGGVHLHLGVEQEFRPARKAHPGLLIDDLKALLAHLATMGIDFKEDHELPGYARAFVHDPFGNRLELLQKLSSS